MIYLDNNATTKVAPEVFESMQPFLTEKYANPSGPYSFGGEIRKEIDKAREKVAELLNCLPEDIIFTSCGTESDNLAVRGILEHQKEKNKRKCHFITSTVEHPAIKNQVNILRKNGFKVTEIPVDKQGNIDLNIYQKHLNKNTSLVSFMYANNETGVIFPIEKLAKMAHNKGAIFHTDAVQAIGKIPIDLSDSNIDLLSLSGHKIHAPKGIGVLYKKKGVILQPQLIGGHQENGLRGGTENVASIVGLGKAAELAKDNLEKENTYVKKLRDKLEESITSKIKDIQINGSIKNRLPNTSNIGFHLIEGESILLYLDQEGICVSSGSACTSGSLQPSHVLKSMKVPFSCIHGSIRFSLSIYNTEREIDIVLEKLPKVVEKLRKLSPFKNLKDININ